LKKPLYLFRPLRLYFSCAGDLPAAPVALPLHIAQVPELQMPDLGPGLSPWRVPSPEP
jgi:hypothetical protein